MLDQRLENKVDCNEPVDGPFQNLSCPAKNPASFNGSYELHVPHAHTAQNVPEIISTIEDHLNHLPKVSRCIVMVECLTPSMPLLSKEIVGDVLTSLAQGDKATAAALLEPYASSTESQFFLKPKSSVEQGYSPGEQLIDHCIQTNEYAFVLATALANSFSAPGHNETPLSIEIVLTDVDSTHEQTFTHTQSWIAENSLRSLTSKIIEVPTSSVKPEALITELESLAGRYIAATAGIINPSRNGAMYRDVWEQASHLSENTDTALVILYGSAHFEIGLKRYQDTLPDGIRIVGLNRGDRPSDPYLPDPYISYSAQLAAKHAQEFLPLNPRERLALFEEEVSSEAKTRLVYCHLLSLAGEDAGHTRTYTGEQAMQEAMMRDLTEIEGVIEECAINALARNSSIASQFWLQGIREVPPSKTPELLQESADEIDLSQASL